MKTFFITLFCLFFLSACATNEKIVIKEKPVYILLEPPVALYQKQKRIKPPDIQNYTQAQWSEKEEILFNHIEKLNKQISDLITDRASTERWVIEQRSLIKEKERDKK